MGQGKINFHVSWMCVCRARGCDLGSWYNGSNSSDTTYKICPVPAQIGWNWHSQTFGFLILNIRWMLLYFSLFSTGSRGVDWWIYNWLVRVTFCGMISRDNLSWSSIHWTHIYKLKDLPFYALFGLRVYGCIPQWTTFLLCSWKKKKNTFHFRWCASSGILTSRLSWLYQGQTPKRISRLSWKLLANVVH